MPRYLQTQVLFRTQTLESEPKWSPAILNLDAVITANSAQVFDNYDLSKPCYPPDSATEIFLIDGSDITINVPFADFMQYFDFVQNKPTATPTVSIPQTPTDFLV